MSAIRINNKLVVIPGYFRIFLALKLYVYFHTVGSDMLLVFFLQRIVIKLKKTMVSNLWPANRIIQYINIPLVVFYSQVIL